MHGQPGFLILPITALFQRTCANSSAHDNPAVHWSSQPSSGRTESEAIDKCCPGVGEYDSSFAQSDRALDVRLRAASIEKNIAVKASPEKNRQAGIRVGRSEDQRINSISGNLPDYYLRNQIWLDFGVKINISAHAAEISPADGIPKSVSRRELIAAESHDCVAPTPTAQAHKRRRSPQTVPILKTIPFPSKKQRYRAAG